MGEGHRSPARCSTEPVVPARPCSRTGRPKRSRALTGDWPPSRSSVTRSTAACACCTPRRRRAVPLEELRQVHAELRRLSSMSPKVICVVGCSAWPADWLNLRHGLGAGPAPGTPGTRRPGAGGPGLQQHRSRSQALAAARNGQVVSAQRAAQAGSARPLRGGSRPHVDRRCLLRVGVVAPRADGRPAIARGPASPPPALVVPRPTRAFVRSLQSRSRSDACATRPAVPFSGVARARQQGERALRYRGQAVGAVAVRAHDIAPADDRQQ